MECCLKMATIKLKMNVGKKAIDFGHEWQRSIIDSSKQKNCGGWNRNWDEYFLWKCGQYHLRVTGVTKSVRSLGASLTHYRTQNEVCFQLVLQFLLYYDREGNVFFNWIVTGDENWVQHFTPWNKTKFTQMETCTILSSKKLSTGFITKESDIDSFWQLRCSKNQVHVKRKRRMQQINVKPWTH